MKNEHCMKSVQIRSFYWSAFSRIRTEYGDLRSKYSYSVQMRENTDQKKLRIWTIFTQPWIVPQRLHFWKVTFLAKVTFFRMNLPSTIPYNNTKNEKKDEIWRALTLSDIVLKNGQTYFDKIFKVGWTIFQHCTRKGWDFLGWSPRASYHQSGMLWKRKLHCDGYFQPGASPKVFTMRNLPQAASRNRTDRYSKFKFRYLNEIVQ